MIRDLVIFLVLWKNEKANPPVVIDRSSELGKIVPEEIERINITINERKKSMGINFGDKTIENTELVKEIFAGSWELLENDRLL